MTSGSGVTWDLQANKVNLPPSISSIAVLIPARRHEPALDPLIHALVERGAGVIVVVDDGSPEDDKAAFAALSRIDRVHLVRHAVNLGKGRALKTGINYFLNSFPQFAGLVTADADGQHSAEDILRVANALLAAPGRAQLGFRRFGRETPLRSRFGNGLTRSVFHFVSGCRVSDTQTGLRAFPAALLPALMALPGERYEYEMTVLGYLCRQGNPPLETPISTIYIDNNRSSSFNPVLDSMRVYFVLLRFYASSLFSAGLDLAGFCVAFWITKNLLIAVIAGRVNSLINFALNRSLVFHRADPIKGSLWRYYLLAAVLAIICYSAIRGLSHLLGWNIVVIKIVVETSLSLVSFSVQRTFVFADKGELVRE
ncbi:MAG: glycosyltransferase [Terracidiphilus sp.]